MLAKQVGEIDGVFGGWVGKGRGWMVDGRGIGMNGNLKPKLRFRATPTGSHVDGHDVE